MKTAEEFLKKKDIDSDWHLRQVEGEFVIEDLLEEYYQLKSEEEIKDLKAELVNGKYYLTLTIENKWGVALWKDKWWSDEYQDGKLLMGIRDDFIKEYYPLPPKQNTLNRDKVINIVHKWEDENRLIMTDGDKIKLVDALCSLSLPTLSEEEIKKASAEHEAAARSDNPNISSDDWYFDYVNEDFEAGAKWAIKELTKKEE